ncbi:hypothetical protein SAMN05192553_105271 [Cyclobacterium xiamenense]|uniref:Uncharacterized protein n=1 Tax=Cyclobacterium xiamenense TaxID=1297121 RepID=A0A1H7AA55_9BACT|nr:hypothetical protein SAMN05192553_105271 [Cyclobacterium xiamenense]
MANTCYPFSFFQIKLNNFIPQLTFIKIRMIFVVYRDIQPILSYKMIETWQVLHWRNRDSSFPNE